LILKFARRLRQLRAGLFGSSFGTGALQRPGNLPLIHALWDQVEERRYRQNSYRQKKLSKNKIDI